MSIAISTDSIRWAHLELDIDAKKVKLIILIVIKMYEATQLTRWIPKRTS